HKIYVDMKLYLLIALVGALTPLTGKAQQKLTDSLYLNHYLLNTDNQLISLGDIGQQTVVIDFWFTGCTSCGYFYRNKLRPIAERYADDDRIAFISVSTDKDREKWLSSVNSGLFCDSSALNLYT